MSIVLLINEPITINHKGVTGRDAHNNEILGTTSSDDVVAYIEQTDAFEVLVGRETYVSTWRVFLLPDVQVSARDEFVRPDGTVLELLGDPNPAYNPRTRATSHIECRARTVTG